MPRKKLTSSLAALILYAATVQSAEVKVNSPDRKVAVTVTDNGGLSCSVYRNSALGDGIEPQKQAK
jgi:archaellum component FlaF (FlaF/FlaG flagellin family)